MSAHDSDFDQMRRDADAKGARIEFARLVAQTNDVLSAMRVQQQMLDVMIVESRAALRDSRAMLLDMDQL